MENVNDYLRKMDATIVDLFSGAPTKTAADNAIVAELAKVYALAALAAAIRDS